VGRHDPFSSLSSYALLLIYHEVHEGARSMTKIKRME